MNLYVRTGTHAVENGGSTIFVGLLLVSSAISGCVAAPGATTAAPAAIAAPAQVSVAASAPEFADAQAALSLVAAIDARLSIMRDVAAAKWLSGAPILDTARESVVLQQVAARAQSLGLAPVATEAFFAEQIRLARNQQQRWFDEWKHAGRCAPCDTPADLQAVRERIDAANEQELAALYLLAPLRDESAAIVVQRMQATSLRHQLPTIDADALMAALRGVVRVTRGPVLDRVRATHVLRVATTGDYAPFSFDANGRLMGADIELARNLATRLGATPAFVRTTWPSLTADLRDGRFDVALSGIGHTPERAALGLYSAPYHEGGKTLLARCTDRERFDTRAELDRPEVRVIVNPGGTNERYVRANVHQARIIVHPDNRGVFAEIAAGRADVMVTDDVEAELQARRWPGQLCRTYPGTLTRGDKRILMAPDLAMQAVVDAWLAEAMAADVPAHEIERAMRAYVSDNATP